MTEEQHLQVLGVDPAPSKPTVLFDGTSFEVLEPLDVRPWLEARLSAEPATVVAWDAPLAFDPATSFYVRPVDKRLADAARAEPAVNTAAFGNLSHWSITCYTLGFPFGEPPAGLQVVDSLPSELKGPVAIEVHPAFALYQWWKLAGRVAPVPAYKKSGRRKRLAAVDELLEAVGSQLQARGVLADALAAGTAGPDDLLDAMVAWEVGTRFARGSTSTVGSAAAGFIVLPEPLQ